MKKPIVAVVLFFFVVVGGIGVLYATGNLDGITNKFFHRSEIMEEENFDKTLAKIKENLNKVESVKAEVEGSSWRKLDDYAPNIYGGRSEINFIFPNKKSISPVRSSDGSMNLEFGVHGTIYETIILGEKIYKNFWYC